MPLYEIMCVATLQSTPQQLVNSLQRLATVVQKGETTKSRGVSVFDCNAMVRRMEGDSFVDDGIALIQFSITRSTLIYDISFFSLQVRVSFVVSRILVFARSRIV